MIEERGKRKMLLPESLIYAFEYLPERDDISGIRIYCDASISEQVAKIFKETFYTEWYNAIEEFIDAYYRQVEYNDFPVYTQYKKYGIFVHVCRLCVYDDSGYSIDVDGTGMYALKSALKSVRKQFPDIKYDGLIAYAWSDPKWGDIVQYELYSDRNNNRVYDFVGETIAEQLKDDLFWKELSYKLYDDNFQELAEFLYAYSDWIGQDDLEKAFNRMIDIISGNDHEKRNSLNEIAKRILSGEKIQKQEDTSIDTSNLPEGYMEALDMVMMAQIFEGPEVVDELSTEELFDIVIEEAENGNTEAKFTAGKYFIADNVEDEKNRAVEWIKEAASAGIQEAEEYISNNSELFG